MLWLILFVMIVLAIGFGFGYGVRELISSRRRATERKKFLRKKEQKRYDESEGQNPNQAAQSAEKAFGQPGSIDGTF